MNPTTKEIPRKIENLDEDINQSIISKSIFLREKENKFRFKFFPKFKEYRQKMIFIDCQFSLENEEIYAHRIVLSKFSKIFMNYFVTLKNETSVVNVPIPININSTFKQMIDFFYEEQLDNDSLNDDPIPLYMMAVIYDVPSLIFILDDIISKKLSISNILIFTSHFKNVKLQPAYKTTFPGLKDTFQGLLERSFKFAPFLADHFCEFPPKNLYDSISPHLLAEVLKKTHFSDEEKVSIIDAYVKQNGDPTEDECYHLQSVIEWKSKDSYRLFINHDANWVTASIAQGPISTILENRKTTINSMIERLSENNRSLNNWSMMSWISDVKNSSGVTNVHDFSLLHFLGTIGGSLCHQINPTLYRFIKAKSSNAVQVPQYREILFDRECFAGESKNYFLSFPYEDDDEDDSPKFCGYEFTSPCFVPKKLVYQPVPGKSYPEKVQGKCFDNDKNLVYQSEIISLVNGSDEVSIDLDINVPVKSIILEMIGLNSNGMKIFRVANFDIIGHFSP